MKMKCAALDHRHPRPGRGEAWVALHKSFKVLSKFFQSLSKYFKVCVVDQTQLGMLFAIHAAASAVSPIFSTPLMHAAKSPEAHLAVLNANDPMS